MQVAQVGVAEKATPFSYIASHIVQVKDKLASGEYPTEEARCFCGADFNDHVVTRFDRYGMPHQMVLCKECGLMRANPRMTREAYDKFYNYEYRQIYDTWEFKKIGVDRDEVFIRDAAFSKRFEEFIEYFDIPTDVVFDIGCNMGAWLTAFKEKGSEVHGVDLGISNVEFGKTKGIDIMQGGIEALYPLNKKADLVIMNHVFEHCLDLWEELEKVKKLLKPDGLLYIGVPGMFASSLDLLFQNAHTYQFTSDTLEYVMNSCGFDAYYCDDSIASLWVMDDQIKAKGKPVHEIEKISDWLSGKPSKVPVVKTINKFSVKQRKESMKKILSYRLPDITELVQKVKADAVIVGGGPSVNDYIDKIKKKQAEGAVIFAIERMYPWCHANGITPDYVCVLDACEDVVEGFTHINPDTVHLIATQSNPKTVELLEGHKMYVFGTPQKGVNSPQIWFDNGYERVCLVNAGGSVTLCAMALAYTMGCRNLHVFGFDCHITNGDYAKGIAGVGVMRNCYEVNIDGRIFKTNNSFLSFLQQFFQLWAMAKGQNLVDNIKIYGDSMVKWASKIDIDGDKDG